MAETPHPGGTCPSTGSLADLPLMQSLDLLLQTPEPISHQMAFLLS